MLHIEYFSCRATFVKARHIMPKEDTPVTVALAAHGPGYGRERRAHLTCSPWCRATAHEFRQKRGVVCTRVVAEARVGKLDPSPDRQSLRMQACGLP